MNILEQPISRTDEARLIAAGSYMQFGDGYRQLTGTETIATGTVGDLLAMIDGLSGDRRTIFIAIGSAFRTPDEARLALVD